MLTPAAKRRRRAEAATATLTRPFRSPVVRGTPKATAAASSTASGDTASPLAAASAAAAQTPDSPSSPHRRHKQPRRATAVAATETPAPDGLTLAGLVDQFSRDLDAGDRTLRRYEQAPSSRPGALLAARQPKKGSSSRGSTSAAGTDDLPGLISRWREAARRAAEEVFELVSARVAQAGGVRAWKAMMAQSSAAWGQDASDNAEAARRGRRRTGDDERRDDGDDNEPAEAEEEAEEQDEEDEEFTMGMMLASLHVGPELLGYDETEERWKD
ncbi:hypothetical protein SPI_04889 [Niveomyces insectorum RCEF 264]|uniref:Uncharacterized protein n=1 Tax=Niveomyces insectorum RCEF 264 TaxID=1081102 RepID=A0A167UYC4_9HYPO|nr:hypothetical protein SPI_04889 [Niveomyces insectorum RCEF 264]